MIRSQKRSNHFDPSAVAFHSEGLEKESDEEGLRLSLGRRTFALRREDVAAAREVVQLTHAWVGRL